MILLQKKIVFPSISPLVLEPYNPPPKIGLYLKATGPFGKTKLIQSPCNTNKPSCNSVLIIQIWSSISHTRNLLDDISMLVCIQHVVVSNHIRNLLGVWLLSRFKSSSLILSKGRKISHAMTKKIK